MNDARQNHAPPSSAKPRWSAAVGWWAAFFVVWLLLVPSWSWAEILVGLFAAALCAALPRATGVAELLSFRPRLGWWSSIAATLLGLPRDFGKLVWALGRQLAGKPIHGQYRRLAIAADGDDPQGRARRALTAAGHSLLPNSYVIGIDPESNTMLLHELVPDVGEGTK
jgi:hypothetical protein